VALDELEAVKVIVNAGDSPNRLSPEGEAELAAVEARYPGKRIIVHPIVESLARLAVIPEVAEGSASSAPSVAARLDDDVAERARDRLPKLRGEF
jgi:hypothetical protein